MTTERNPEETKKKILDVAQELFVKKGYDNTSIQDIIDGLGGMTKGAIYHHFKSKFDILDTLLENKSQEDMKSLEEGSNGLESLRNMILMSLRAYTTQSITYSAAVTLKSPRMIGEQYLELLDVSKEVEKFINQGIEDGSIITNYPKEVAEFMLLYMNMRIGLHFTEITKEEFVKKIDFIKFTLEKIGVPIFNDEIVMEAEKLYDYLHREK